jgi:3-methyl-2-oxobutanoate hydroxymethyltransferase
VKSKVTIPALQQMKRDGRKIVGVVVYDYQMAQIVDRAGVDIVSVGDSVGVNMWGHHSELEVTLDQMLLVCKAVRAGVERALVSCDFPYGPLQEGADAAVRAARYLVENAGADMLKLDAASEHPDAVRAIAAQGIPVWAQFRGKGEDRGNGEGGREKRTDEFVAEAKLLEQAGAAMLDFTHSGPVAGPAVTAAVAIPVIGGLGGGPWLDGRVRALVNAVGYMATAVDDTTERYANVARITLDAMKTYAEDVRAARQIRGEPSPRAVLASKPTAEGGR